MGGDLIGIKIVPEKRSDSTLGIQYWRERGRGREKEGEKKEERGGEGDKFLNKDHKMGIEQV